MRAIRLTATALLLAALTTVGASSAQAAPSAGALAPASSGWTWTPQNAGWTW
ncbi:hypothetical protein JNB_07209 [Janibacter sp. HTCC2649]|uniref:hypothetical protein n=1 Tax=Janibacter sp. HTCC2649 TaxID=313589 RepID=UPI0000670A1A|nr:hypothetical protein [Janibacter sp. HTCC2649]EAP99939.1 hypothetical protein JNB_07209 [Janibacter sp. HTCC2649]